MTVDELTVEEEVEDDAAGVPPSLHPARTSPAATSEKTVKPEVRPMGHLPDGHHMSRATAWRMRLIRM